MHFIGSNLHMGVVHCCFHDHLSWEGKPYQVWNKSSSCSVFLIWMRILSLGHWDISLGILLLPCHNSIILPVSTNHNSVLVNWNFSQEKDDSVSVHVWYFLVFIICGFSFVLKGLILFLPQKLACITLSILLLHSW